MGKYDKVNKFLRPLPVKDVSFQSKVDDKKNELYKNKNSIGLAIAYTELRDRKEVIEDLSKKNNIEIEAVKQLITESFSREGIKSIDLNIGWKISLSSEPVASIKDKEKFRLWCIENNLEKSLILPYQSTNSLIKEKLLNIVEQPRPDWIKKDSKDIHQEERSYTIAEVLPGVEAFMINKLIKRKI